VTTPSIAFLYHERYDGRGFSPLSDSWRRYRMALDLFDDLELLPRVLRVRPEPATERELETVHSPAYVRWVQERVATGEGRFDRSTPVYPGLYERALVAVGATLTGARLIAAGEALTAFNPGGGLHHASRERASGFCIFNDVVIGVRALQREFGLRRIAVVDLDGHHGDGTQDELYHEPLLYISLHRYDGHFYPATGTPDEIGEGPGRGYNANVGLPRQCGDAAYRYALHAIVAPLLRAYRPEIIVLQYGVDGHYDDTMVRLGLTTALYREMAVLMRALAGELCGGRLLVTGGGGYKPEAASRCWAILMAVLVGDDPRPDDPRYGVLFDHESPAPDPTALQQVMETVSYLRAALLGPDAPLSMLHDSRTPWS